MNIFTFLFVGLLAILHAIFAITLAVAIVFNIKAGLKYRNKLAQQIEELRLSRMLGTLGIDTEAYLHSEQGLEIKKQIERCAGCGNTQTCDEQLAAGDVSADNIDYCDNRDDLRSIISKQQALKS